MIASTQYCGKISKLAMVAPLAEITRPIKRTIVLRTGLGFRQGYVSKFSRQSPREYAHHLRPLVAKSAYLTVTLDNGVVLSADQNVYRKKPSAMEIADSERY